MAKLFINDVLTDEDAAFIPVDDRGFRFGDGVFETIPVHRGRPYLWQYHGERLEAGLKALSIACALQGLGAQVTQLLQENQVAQGLVRIAISRGVGSQGYLPASQSPPTVIQTMQRPALPAQEASLWLSSLEKISPRALPTACKLAQGVNATLARMEASIQHCHEALQLNSEGFIAEASAANIFWLAGGKLYTPSLHSGALAGVTRRRMMELSPYPVEEGNYTLEHLKAAESVMLTNASLGIVPVQSLQPLGLKWENTGLAETFSTLRRQDIANGVY